MSTSDVSILRRLSTAQESLPQRYRHQPNLSKLIYYREAWENAFSHGAKNVYVLSMKIGKGFYVVTLHDGTPFSSEDALEQAFYPNTTVGSKGANGCGGMLAPTMLVSRISDYHHMILSKSSKGHMFWQATVRDDRSIHACRVDDKILDDIRTRLGELYNKINVAYISRHDPITSKGTNCFQNTASMLLAKDMCDDLLHSGRKVFVYEHVLLNTEDNLDHYLQTTSHTNPVQLVTKDTFDGVLFHGKHILHAKECRIKHEDTVVIFDADIEITTYAGLTRSVRLADHRFNYIALRGPKRGQGVSNCVRPDFNTFITWGFQSDPSLTRLNRHPCYAGVHMEMASSILEMNFSNSKEEFADAYDHPVTSEIAKLVKSKIPDREVRLRRQPHARLVLNIRQIRGVEHNKVRHAVAEYTSADFRSMLGNIDEMFMLIDKNKAVSVLAESLNRAMNNPDNKATLDLLRSESASLWPRDLSSLAYLPVASKTKENYLRFTSINNDSGTGNAVRLIKPGMKRDGLLVHADTNTPVDPSWSFSAYSNSQDKLVSTGDGEWTLRLSDLHLMDENKTWNKVTIDEWLKCTDRERMIPYRQLKFMHDGTVYNLNTEADLPQRFIHASPQPGALVAAKLQNPTGKDLQRTQNMFKVMTPSSRYVSIYNGKVEMNQANNTINILFRNLPSKKNFRDKLWLQVEDATREADKNLSGVNCVWHGVKGQQLQEEWDDVHQYMINLIIDRHFKESRILLTKKEIEEEIESAGLSLPQAEPVV